MEKQLMLGNEAIAHGARDAGVQVLCAYPGTPSTEIAETMAQLGDVYTQWAANEVVAAEVAMGASVSGARAMCCMKHVGLNVASEVLFTGAYTGVNGPLVLVVADDPGMHSSQNEQDTRMIADAAHVPVLEPADSQQAYDFMGLALSMSEQFDLPVIVRLTTRVAHSRGFVIPHERVSVPVRPYEKNPQKYIMMPSNAVGRKVSLLERMANVAQHGETEDFNAVERGEGSVGFVCAGICYEYVKEAMPQAPILHLGMVNPLPLEKIRTFAASVETLYVVEELEPYLENKLKAAGIDCVGQAVFTKCGELSAAAIREVVLGTKVEVQAEKNLPPRPPVLCAGCPHRATFLTLKALKATAFGDIGCYTLGAAPPLSAMDTTLCMGASISMAFGAQLAQGRDFARSSVAVIGDSTFFHSGLSGLASASYNKADITVVIVDNAITGMTGHQDNPSTGRTLMGETVAPLSIEDTCRALGAVSCVVVDPVDQSALKAAVQAAWAEDGVSVIIARRPCVLIEKATKRMTVNQETCIRCGRCVQTACPALSRQEGVIVIDDASCNGCGLCARQCPNGSLTEVAR